MSQDLKKKLKDLIRRNQLDLAVDLLSEHFDSNEVILLEAHYNKLKIKKIERSLPQSELDQELNALIMNILSFLDTIKETPTPKEKQTKITDFKDDFSLALARVTIARLLLDNYTSSEAVNITWLNNTSGLKSRRLIVFFMDELKKYDLLNEEKIDNKTCYRLNQRGKELLERLFETKEKL